MILWYTSPIYDLRKKPFNSKLLCIVIVKYFVQKLPNLKILNHHALQQLKGFTPLLLNTENIKHVTQNAFYNFSTSTIPTYLPISPSLPFLHLLNLPLTCRKGSCSTVTIWPKSSYFKSYSVISFTYQLSDSTFIPRFEEIALTILFFAK